MRSIIVFVVLTISLQAFGQQITLDPAISTESLIVESLEEVGGDFIHVGWKGGVQEQAYIERTTTTGLTVWSKLFDLASRFNASVKTASNETVAVGSSNDTTAFVTKIDPSGSGNVLWTRTFGAVDSVMVFQDVDVDPLGNIVAVGNINHWNSSIRREFTMKISPSGDVLWAKKLEGSGGSRYAERVFVKGDSICVFGTGYNNGRDVSLSIYRLSDGAFIDHLFYGYGQNEFFVDAVPFQGGFCFTFTSDGYGPIVAKLSPSLNLVCDPMLITPFSDNLSGGMLTTNGTSLFISGSVTGSGYTGSYALSLSQNLTTINWMRKVTPGLPAGPAPASFHSMVRPNGDLMFVDVKDGTTFGSIRGTIVTALSSVGTPVASYCNNPTLMDSENAIVNFPVIIRASVTRAQSSMNLSIGTDVNDAPYPSIVINCTLTVLPVELVLFDAKKDGETTLVTWQTASERESSHFNIVRSKDGFNFENIGEVSAARNSHQMLRYSFVDDSPLTGDSYYRLESVDLDGSTDFSNVVAVHFDERTETYVVYPNPAIAGEAINIKGEFQSVEAFSQLGQKVVTQRNGQQLTIMSAPGVYLLTLISANGTTETVRVVTN